jgi:hypothetical protein
MEFIRIRASVAIVALHEGSYQEDFKMKKTFALVVAIAGMFILNESASAQGNRFVQVTSNCANGRCNQAFIVNGPQYSMPSLQVTPDANWSFPTYSVPIPTQPVMPQKVAPAPLVIPTFWATTSSESTIYIDGIAYGLLLNGTYAKIEDGTYARLSGQYLVQK